MGGRPHPFTAPPPRYPIDSIPRHLGLSSVPSIRTQIEEDWCWVVVGGWEWGIYGIPAGIGPRVSHPNLSTSGKNHQRRPPHLSNGRQRFPGSPTHVPISINPSICARYKATHSTISLFGNVPSTNPFAFLHIRTQWPAPHLDRTHLANISNMPTTAKIPSRHSLVITILPLFGICRALWLNPVGSDTRTCPSLANTTTQPLL